MTITASGVLEVADRQVKGPRVVASSFWSNTTNFISQQTTTVNTEVEPPGQLT